jgi:hypothetical protein
MGLLAFIRTDFTNPPSSVREFAAMLHAHEEGHDLWQRPGEGSAAGDGRRRGQCQMP